MFFYGKEIKASLVRATALGQSRVIFSKFAGTSGRKARRHRGIHPLCGPSQTPACVLKPQALICSQYRVCAQVCVCICTRLYMHVSFNVCSNEVPLYTYYTGVSMCVYFCVCLFTYGLC